jgi:RNA polymerase sigma factor (sigma-70 family)
MMRVAVEESRTGGSRLEDLYRLHAGAGVRLAYLITGDQALAEDIVQEAFVKLAARLVHLRDPDGLAPYLRQIIVNLTNEHFRRRKLERRYLEREAALPKETDGPDVAERDAVCGPCYARSPPASGPPSCSASTRTSRSPRRPR